MELGTRVMIELDYCFGDHRDNLNSRPGVLVNRSRFEEKFRESFESFDDVGNLVDDLLGLTKLAHDSGANTYVEFDEPYEQVDGSYVYVTQVCPQDVLEI